MNLQKHFIFINGVDKTYQVESIRLDGYKYAIKFHNADKVYSYSKDKVIWLTNPMNVELEGCHIFINGKKEKSIKAASLFTNGGTKYYAITFSNDFIEHYAESEVDIRRSCLIGKTMNVLDYLHQCAGINTLGVNEEDASSKGILASIYSRIDFVDEKTAAAVYLDPQQSIKESNLGTKLFPFGCNASQERAVKAAFSNQISVIQGPPGTGKTQTILNIIANLLVAKKSVLIVSNNNSATENVLEKLSKNGLDFLVAPLGKRENKDTFVANQPPLNPEIPSWRKTAMELNRASSEVKSNLEKVESVFEMQERLAVCRQELAEVEIEKTHFDQEHEKIFTDTGVKISSAKILKFLGSIKNFAVKYEDVSNGFLKRLKLLLGKFSLELQLRFLFTIKDELTFDSVPRIITQLDWLFYVRRIRELKSEIQNIEVKLSQLDANALMKSLTDNSMTILKASLAKRYKHERAIVRSAQEIFNGGEIFIEDYPIVLSTTFSSKMCFNGDTLFDYVIMDEASQVAVDTGFLALTCAKNAVIVGDTMQLPNVVTEEDAAKLNEIRKTSSVPDTYDAAKHSFLSSVLATIPNVPETLLREHYRCHPDIINFCNQKFYGGNLLIMTKRQDEEKHLLALKTSEGHHCRGHYNQREIDAVKVELMPLLDNLEETGIIAPYNRQVEQFHTQIPEIEVATVHKYQGREKDTIIMSVTDDVITEFSDNANLLNVAVSRAKNKFCLVVTGNPQELKGNIYDLLGYITYQQGVVIESKLRSIYDYLFSQIEASRRDANVSEYDSENLTFELIEKIRTTYPQLSHIKTLCHYPMRSLIGGVFGLSEREAQYAMHPATHIDFLIINRVSKQPLLAIETDGYSYHNDKTEQFQRDRLKDHILEIYGLPLLRLSTIGHSEEQRIVEALLNLY
ncbi:MAG: AAA domain-containing protein [Roseburia sp.]|nr:AAA domain-containing protein [Roseburia sp.]